MVTHFTACRVYSGRAQLLDWTSPFHFEGLGIISIAARFGALLRDAVMSKLKRCGAKLACTETPDAAIVLRRESWPRNVLKPDLLYRAFLLVMLPLARASPTTTSNRGNGIA